MRPTLLISPMLLELQARVTAVRDGSTTTSVQMSGTCTRHAQHATKAPGTGTERGALCGRWVRALMTGHVAAHQGAVFYLGS